MQATGQSRSGCKLLAAALFFLPVGMLAAQEPPAPAPAADPPGRVARIAYLQGNVSLEPSGVESFSQAEVNYPLTAGDRIYADLQALTELQTSGMTVRMSNGADVTIASLTDQIAQFGLAQGSIRVNTQDLTTPDGTAGTVEIDTPQRKHPGPDSRRYSRRQLPPERHDGRHRHLRPGADHRTQLRADAWSWPGAPALGSESRERATGRPAGGGCARPLRPATQRGRAGRT